jgi:hypothetical protein
MVRVSINGFYFHGGELCCVKEDHGATCLVYFLNGRVDNEVAITELDTIRSSFMGGTYVLPLENKLLFRVAMGSNSREQSFINALLKPVALHIIDENSDGSLILSVGLSTNREDVQTMFIHQDYLELIINKEPIMSNEDYVKGDQVKLVKKSRYTKQKRLTIGDKFNFIDEYNGTLMVSNKDEDVFYIENAMLRKVKK